MADAALEAAMVHSSTKKRVTITIDETVTEVSHPMKKKKKKGGRFGVGMKRTSTSSFHSKEGSLPSRKESMSNMLAVKQ